MALICITIPCLTDNYAYLLHDPTSGRTAVVDVPEAAPILRALAFREWSLSDIFLTHHHDDHILGVAELRAATGAQVWGAAADAHRLPLLDHALTAGDEISFGQDTGVVIDAPGHTVGHIAYYFGQTGLAFTGDSLMAGGCGRLFEGSAAQMWETLGKFAILPAHTLICSGHEYTAANLRFAATIEPENGAIVARIMRVAKARAEGRPTVPSRLSGELATNPFLRSGEPQIKAALGLPDASDAVVFAELRALKDKF
jgi:hydroxyacylglutathione hydrolase